MHKYYNSFKSFVLLFIRWDLFFPVWHLPLSLPFPSPPLPSFSNCRYLILRALLNPWMIRVISWKKARDFISFRLCEKSCCNKLWDIITVSGMDWWTCSNKVPWLAACSRSTSCPCCLLEVRAQTLVMPAGLLEANVRHTALWYCCLTHPVRLLAQMIITTNFSSKFKMIVGLTNFKTEIFCEKAVRVVFLALQFIWGV